jgi:hypothetical protein
MKISDPYRENCDFPVSITVHSGSSGPDEPGEGREKTIGFPENQALKKKEFG